MLLVFFLLLVGWINRADGLIPGTLIQKSTQNPGFGGMGAHAGLVFRRAHAGGFAPKVVPIVGRHFVQCSLWAVIFVNIVHCG